MVSTPDKTDRPYPARQGRLPRDLQEVTAEWLSQLLAHRYPGLVVEDFQVVEVKNSHTTKLRAALQYNAVGRSAGLPRNVCLKANWSLLGKFDGQFANGSQTYAGAGTLRYTW